MLPAHLAENIRKQVLYYLQSTFSFRDKRVEKSFERFLEDPDTGLFKGPWIHLRRPFRPAPEGVDLPFDINIPFHPFRHQYRSWLRLVSKNNIPKSTIITTGTGSGKTECFLFPILDHCLREKKKGRQGIKAIILYPMNALASDQEKRFAEMIWKDATLKSAGITVGNYTGRYDLSGDGAGNESGTKSMGPDHGITNHDAQQETPPDILLTNYKMLDFLLMRPQDQQLWRYNESEVLRYLVLDELHTYDGAQGADVACLIRRLKERLKIKRGELCVVGTSATLDSRDVTKDSQTGGQGSVDAAEIGRDRLARFAGTLFEENISPEAVIDEDRLEVEEIVHTDPLEMALPSPNECVPFDYEDALAYAQRQSGVWTGPEYLHPDGATEEDIDKAVEQWSLQLGKWLKKTKLFKYLLEIFHLAEINRDDPLTWTALVERLSQRELALSAVKNHIDRQYILTSFFALVAYAQELRSGKAYPLVPTQVQLWVRELRRLGRIVSEAPAFSWLDEPATGVRPLPTFHCSECGESGWISIHDISKDTQIQAHGVDGLQLVDDPKLIYQGWFGHNEAKDQHIVTMSPCRHDELPAGDGKVVQQELDFERWYICPASLVLRKGDGPCPTTNDSRRFGVRISRETRQLESGKVIGDQGCPRCGSKVGMFFIGSQAATISSVAIDEMFGSLLNNDPKLLAFTDSVQDASHRAGFFTSRTYRFTYRTALQHVIDAAGAQGLRLSDAGKRLVEWWAEKQSGRPGSVRESMGAIMPPDLQLYKPYLDYRNSTADEKPPETLYKEITERLAWEATSEFGLMQTHGRTMELSGSACLGWDEAYIDKTVNVLREHLPGISPSFEKIDNDSLKLWLYGMLHRYRERGALSHPFLNSYARQSYWGKYPFNRTVPGRETYPPSSRYRPHLMVTQPLKGHEYVFASTKGNLSPWHVLWMRRALKQPGIDETTLIDLTQALFEAGRTAGLFKKLHQDGARVFYAIAAEAALLYSEGVCLVCSESERSIVRPETEAALWKEAPSMEYYAPHGRYYVGYFSPRQLYYQDRYRKGALRRVVAQEHTGLLGTEERENLERNFAKAEHADDPNILTCTSTLEMGIDIGDLSSTLLCSIPPNTASYLQRIGRAGRATGTSLIISVVNQRPHDLFFYARPLEMLKGRVDPPGCWLDASAVLSRQYLGYCFDCCSHNGELKELPRTGKQLVDDLAKPEGNIPKMLEWVTKNEDDLRNVFLNRFQEHLQVDTRDRFLRETETELVRQRIHKAVNDFDRVRRDLENARSRLQEQLKNIGSEEKDARREIEQELNILKGRMRGVSRTNALEILTDYGLLPNYAFPERGVKFYGAVYNRHRSGEQDLPPVELSRPAGSALSELAPRNFFYTHSRQFEIQQIAIGNPQQPLVEKWGICGICGHMRRVDEMEKPEAVPACPQCGHDGDHNSQLDVGQQRFFLEYAKSQALSYMDHYESLSGDRNEERQREYYQIIRSFDQTIESPAGAVGDDELPFGIEYRAAMVTREVNVGFGNMHGDVPFGPGKSAPEEGFLVCKHCGIVSHAAARPEDIVHRRSCQGRRKLEKMKQEGKSGNPFKWEQVYLYRELKSEAIRLLLPLTDDEDIETLVACLYLGLRLRFEGNPAHLIVAPQILPDAATGIEKHYLVLMDAVPGGTGYLKTMYQEKDEQERPGEGIMSVLRLARDALESCTCRRLNQQQDKDDTDGCYRCIRTYHLQYKADQISRERGIVLLNRIIEAGDRRTEKEALEDIKPDSLFGSVLEKKFVESLQAFVEDRQGKWETTIIKGTQGFRFSFPGAGVIWELELQPKLGLAQGVSEMCQPDFMLSADDGHVRPVAIFTDGFEFHCHPHNRIEDDMKKRRSIMESGNYFVWSITWDDLITDNAQHNMVCHGNVMPLLEKYAAAAKSSIQNVPLATAIVRNGFEQIKAFVDCPHSQGWESLASFVAFWPLQLLSSKRSVVVEELRSALEVWRTGGGMVGVANNEAGTFVFNDKTCLNQDLISCISVEDILSNRKSQVVVLGRLGDSESEVTGSDYRERWRRFLACLNVYQFCEGFSFWSAREAQAGLAPEIPLAPSTGISEQWKEILDNTTASIRPFVPVLAAAEIQVPVVEHFNDAIDDDAFAELAWPNLSPPVAVLAGDQSDFASQWQQKGWKIVVPDDLQAKGAGFLIEIIAKST